MTTWPIDDVEPVQSTPITSPLSEWKLSGTGELPRSSSMTEWTKLSSLAPGTCFETRDGWRAVRGEINCYTGEQSDDFVTCMGLDGVIQDLIELTLEVRALHVLTADEVAALKEET